MVNYKYKNKFLTLNNINMKKALIFIGLVSFAGAIIYGTSFVVEDEDEEENSGSKKSKEELFFIDEINNIESIEWSKDSIDNLKMSIQMSKNHKRISEKAQNHLLSTLEHMESVTLQNSFNKWVSNNCNAPIDRTLSSRIMELSSQRPTDPQLKKCKQGHLSYGMQNSIKNKYNYLCSVEYNPNKRKEIDRLIATHLENPKIRNCYNVRELKKEINEGLTLLFDFHRDYLYEVSIGDLAAFTTFYYLHETEFNKYPWYKNDYDRIKRDGFIQINYNDEI